MVTNLSQARLSDLIAHIYDCVLNPNIWKQVLEDMRGEFGFANAVLAINTLAGSADFFAMTRIDVESLKLSNENHGPEMMAMWGGDRIQHYALGEPIVLSRLQPREILRATRWYQDWARPRGLADALTIRLTNDPRSYGNVTLGQAGDDVSDDQIEGMRFLAPHLRRAVTISNVLENQAVEAATFSGLVDAFKAGVVLVDEDCGVVYSNPAAQAMLAKGEPIQMRHGSIAVATEMTRNGLVAAVQQAAKDETKLGERGIGIPVRHSMGDPAVIHVLPLRRGTLRPGLDQRAVAALFIIPTTSQSQMPHDALVLLYDLTPAEVRVCEMVGQGASPSAIGATLGVSVNTVRTHLGRVFDKTGTKRQADLVALVASLTLRI